MKRMICLVLALLMALSLAVPVFADGEADVSPAPEATEPPAAATRTVTLTDAKGVSYGTATVTDGVLGALSTPSRTGWTFEAWYDGPVTETEDYHDSTDASTYWRWNIQTSGNLVQAGSHIDDSVSTLYAKFKPTNITYKMYQNGWKGGFGALSCGREYGMPFTGTVYSWNGPGDSWDGYVFDGWYTASGVRMTDGTPVTGEDVYAHWHKVSDPSVNQDTASRDYDAGKEIKSITGITAKKNIHAVGESITATANLSPSSANPKGLTWSSSDSGIVSVTQTVPGGNQYSPSATLTARGEGTATITVRAENGASASIDVKVGHNFSVLIYGYDATCTKEGWKQYKCSMCDTRKNVTLPVLDHSYTRETVTPATCTSAAVRHQVCSMCGKTNDVTDGAALGHSWNTKEITVCGVKGTVTERTCSVCGVTEIDGSLTAADHKWNSSYTVDTEATCGAPGSKSIHCANCDAIKNSQVIPASGSHTWGEWVTVKKATYKETGLKERTCTVCGTKVSEVLPLVSNVPGGDNNKGDGSDNDNDEPETTPDPDATPNPDATPEPEDPDVTPAPVPESPSDDIVVGEDGKLYMQTEAGENLTGKQQADNGKTYYFSVSDGHMMKNGIINAGNGTKYLAAADGELLTGKQTVGSTSYYFSAKDGHMMKGGIVNAGNGTKYLASSTGALLTGVQTVGDNSYYFSAKDGHMMKNGWANAGNGVSYLLDKNGVIIDTRTN